MVNEVWVVAHDRLGDRARVDDPFAVPTELGQPQSARPGLALAQDGPLATQLEIDLGQLEPVGGLLDRRQPSRAALGRSLTQEVAPAGQRAPSDPAPKLVELGDSEPIG